MRFGEKREGDLDSKGPATIDITLEDTFPADYGSTRVAVISPNRSCARLADARSKPEDGREALEEGEECRVYG